MTRTPRSVAESVAVELHQDDLVGPHTDLEESSGYVLTGAKFFASLNGQGPGIVLSFVRVKVDAT